MAYSGNAADIGFFKIHPAIGVARLADGPDSYEFFDYHAKREAGEVEYKTEISPGQWRWKRQDVQYKIFAYGSDGIGLGEVTAEYMESQGMTASWDARVANRKMFHRGNAAKLEATANGDANNGELVATNPYPWRTGPEDDIHLGAISADGLFSAPKGGVYREDNTKRIFNYSEGFTRYAGVTDTTSDGTISVKITGAGADDKPVVAACVVVAPQDQAPDLTPAMVNSGTIRSWPVQTKKDLGFPGKSRVIHNKAEAEAFGMDQLMWLTMNGDYSPGLEVNMSPSGYSQEAPMKNPANAFYDTQSAGGVTVDGNKVVSQYEIRPRYADALIPSEVDHGMLTSGLCSTWQTDMTACVGYWGATFPRSVKYEDQNRPYPTYRRTANDRNTAYSVAEDYNAYKDTMGVATGTDINSLPEKERHNENVGGTPTAPYPLKPNFD